MKQTVERLLVLGCGYVGEKLAVACMDQGMHVLATTRSEERAAVLQHMGIEAYLAASPADLPHTVWASLDAVLDSIPLGRDDQGMHASQLQWLPKVAALCSHLKWAGYLSTTGVYGDAKGAWVDESWSCKPSSARGVERLVAEKMWLESGLPVEVFRLAGIYGAERNILNRLRAGEYKAVAWSPPHYSSRIHVDDIVAALMAAIQRPRAGRIVNLSDDMPLPHAEYVCEIAAMIGATDPVILSVQEGELQLSASVLSFFQDNKRVSNRLMHDELLPDLLYPDFRCGMRSIVGQIAGLSVD